MAKRSRRRRDPRPPRFVWKRGDIIKLVACLDYSLEQKFDFEITAIGHIARRTGREVTAKLIRQALQKEYKTYGRLGENDTFKDFLSEGSAFLVGYCDSDRESIREEISHIEPSRSRYWLRSTPLESRSQSRTLSSNHYQSSETSTLSIHATPEFEGFGEDVDQLGDAGKRTNGKEANRTESQVLNSEQGSSERSQSRTKTAALPPRVKREHGRGPFAETPPHASRTPPLAAGHDNGMRALEQKLAAKDEELQVILRENMEQKHYIFTLSNRLSAAEFECEQIRDSAKKAAEYSSDVLMQRDLRYENSVLKGQLERMTRQRQVIAQVDTNSLKPSDRTIWQEFELIATDLKDACSSVEITVPTSSPTTNGETDSWAQRVAHCTFSQLLTGAIDTDVSEFHLVRALAAAGISDLVFESSFPDFLARESPILDQYRNHILAKAGPQTLYQLDVLACKSVMSEAYYQTHILQASAKTLSTKFSSALAHLLSPNDQTTAGAEPDGLFPSHCSSGSSSSSHHTEENPVAKVFNEAFARALTLKQDLVVLSRSTYKLVFFRPGDVFDPHTMMRDGEGYRAFAPARARAREKKVAEDLRDQRRAEGEGSRVKICLFPALYSRPERELTGDDYGVGACVTNCLVDCDNFVADEPDTGEGMFSLVVKGVVLV